MSCSIELILFFPKNSVELECETFWVFLEGL